MKNGRTESRGVSFQEDTGRSHSHPKYSAGGRDLISKPHVTLGQEERARGSHRRSGRPGRRTGSTHAPAAASHHGQLCIPFLFRKDDANVSFSSTGRHDLSLPLATAFIQHRITEACVTEAKLFKDTETCSRQGVYNLMTRSSTIWTATKRGSIGKYSPL